jgi:hypothetical protein
MLITSCTNNWWFGSGFSFRVWLPLLGKRMNDDDRHSLLFPALRELLLLTAAASPATGWPAMACG